tara:strand:+ start:224 stop:370 length:147 start_codon:yes stop_codon:yes gene_type:complete
MKKAEEVLEALQQMRKDNPNNYDFGTKIRAFLKAIEEGVEYEEVRVKR